jgi:4-hydroxy-2-oxoglutarate aldolase
MSTTWFGSLTSPSNMHIYPINHGSSTQLTFRIKYTYYTMVSTIARNPHVPAPGVYTPAITFFDPESDTLMPVEQAKYYSYLSRTGLTGLVILGTNAETFLLTREERSTLLKLARQSVPENFPIIAGVGGHSTKQVLEYISDAHAAGADYALVLPAAYFGKQTTPTVVKRFYKSIAEASALPILIYNFPAVCNGLDLDSDTITALAQAHSNIVGVKLTCGSVGKITRLAATFTPERFVTFGGQSDFLVGGLAAGSAGCIAAFGNIFPKTVVQIYKLWKSGKHDQAMELQKEAALAESPTKAGVAATKYAVSQFSAKAAGIQGDLEALLRPRQPYEEPTPAAKEQIVRVMAEMDMIERVL